LAAYISVIPTMPYIPFSATKMVKLTPSGIVTGGDFGTGSPEGGIDYRFF